MTSDRRRLPSAERAAEVERELRLARAVDAYRTFYPAVSAWSFFQDNIAQGMEVNARHGYCQYTPEKNALTPNSDTPYAVVLLDMTDGPMVLEVPAGPVMGVLNDWYFQEVGDVGLPGPDAGRGGRYLLVGPGFTGTVPEDGYYIVRSGANHCLAVIRAVPGSDGVAGAMHLLSSIKTYRLGEADRTEMVDVTGQAFAVTSATREESIDCWRAIHDIINSEVLQDGYYMEYGRLAALGILRGQPFPEDRPTHELLLEAAQIALEQMTVEALSSGRPDRLVWPDRTWEWAGLVTDTGFTTPDFMDVYARDRWFYQATLYSKRMFPRAAGVGSIYLLAAKDADGQPLSGDKTYRLRVPAPVPAGQFWSLTAYDVRFRSEINVSNKAAAISSLADSMTPDADGFVDVYLGPHPVADGAAPWIETVPGEDWFVYFRVYGPGEAAFDGSWRLGDITVVDD